MSEQELMAVALEEARMAAREGEVPVGAAVMRDGALISRARNCREGGADPTAHAEILALREAARALGSWRLEGCIMAVTLEPCPMCAGALRAARIKRVVYGACDAETGSCGSALDLLSFPGLGPTVEASGGIMGEECAALLQAFFADRRP